MRGGMLFLAISFIVILGLPMDTPAATPSAPLSSLFPGLKSPIDKRADVKFVLTLSSWKTESWARIDPASFDSMLELDGQRDAVVTVTSWQIVAPVATFLANVTVDGDTQPVNVNARLQLIVSGQERARVYCDQLGGVVIGVHARRSPSGDSILRMVFDRIKNEILLPERYRR